MIEVITGYIASAPERLEPSTCEKPVTMKIRASAEMMRIGRSHFGACGSIAPFSKGTAVLCKITHTSNQSVIAIQKLVRNAERTGAISRKVIVEIAKQIFQERVRARWVYMKI